MRLIPVLDLKAGQAVHAVAGDRAHYQPLRSRLHASSEPAALARAYRETLGLRELYVADLDAIAGAPPDLPLLRTLSRLGFTLWVDAGVRHEASVAPLLSAGAGVVIAALETLGGPDDLRGMVSEFGAHRLAFGLDLERGEPRVAAGADWGTCEPLRLAQIALSSGVGRVVVLDIARVGTGAGPGTLGLVADLARLGSDVEIIAGGGISEVTDLEALRQAGAAAVLVGSALHDGRIGPSEVKQVQG